jgi:biopolymer transport protein ExbB
MDLLSERLAALVDLGGIVIVILLVLSILVVAAVLWKVWQFWALGVGRHTAIDRALALFDAGDRRGAAEALGTSRNHMAPVLAAALLADAEAKPRLVAMAEARLAEVTRGFRLLDSVAQVAPLLGLFGTVLGMIDAFRALQEAGDAVDPSVLAGGIWVALLTTAAGLAVAMPTTLALTFFESRAARERARVDLALEALFHPMAATSTTSAERPSAARTGAFAHGT